MSFCSRLTTVKIVEKIRDSMGFAFQKNSEFTGLFNHYISRVEESGVLPSLKEKYLDPEPDPITSYETLTGQEAFVLGYDTLLFPFMALAVGLAMAVAMLLWENKGFMKKKGNNSLTFVEQNMY